MDLSTIVLPAPMKLFFDSETSGKCDFKKPPGHPSQPRLAESYEFCFGKPPEETHDAMADVKSMMAVHFWRLKNSLTQAAGDR